MKNYVIRYTVEYSIMIEAESEEAALAEANSIPLDEWEMVDISTEAEASLTRPAPRAAIWQ